MQRGIISAVDGRRARVKRPDGHVTGWLYLGSAVASVSVGDVVFYTSYGHDGLIEHVIDAGVAVGEPGAAGITPHIGINGNWYLGDTDTGVAATGPQGYTPVKDLDYFDGDDGVTPHIGVNGNWYIGETDTGISATGEDGTDGITPHIGVNGNWYLGETDTGIPATGPDGGDGVTPHIGANGNWYIGETDTGVPATGADGEDGTDGVGVPPGGTDGQALLKSGSTNYVTAWGNVWLRSDLSVESGTCTLELYGLTTAGNPTYSTQYGEYVRVDDNVIVPFNFVLTNLGGMSGSIRISGLPYTADASSSAAIAAVNASNITRTGICAVLAQILANTSTVSMRIQYEASGVLSEGVLSSTHLANDSYLRGVLTYKAA